jgi:hypothetical protein
MTHEPLEIALLVPEHTRRAADSFDFRLPVMTPEQAEREGWAPITTNISARTERHILASVESTLFPHGRWIRTGPQTYQAARPRDSIKKEKGTGRDE